MVILEKTWFQQWARPEGRFISGRLDYGYGLRARCRIGASHRPTRLSFELEEVGADWPFLPAKGNALVEQPSRPLAAAAGVGSRSCQEVIHDTLHWFRCP